MFRMFISSFLSFSFLIASSITAKNAGERLNVDQSAVAKINKVHSVKKNQLTKAEQQKKTEAFKAKSGTLKKEMDTKVNIAKKMFSAKNQNKIANKSIQKSTSNFDPNSISLKMKRSNSYKRQLSSEASFDRNVINADSEVVYKRHPKISNKAIDVNALENTRENAPQSPEKNISENFLPENLRDKLSDLELRSLYEDIIDNQNHISNASRDDVWLNTQEVEFVVYNQDGTPTYLINKYYDDNHKNNESVYYYYDGYNFVLDQLSNPL